MRLLNLYIFIYIQLFPNTLSRRLCSYKTYKPIKICKDCKYFITNKNECGKFYTLVTGEKIYESVQIVRSDEQKCGELAISFEPIRYKIANIPDYLLKCWIIMIIFIPLVTAWINILYLFRN